MDGDRDTVLDLCEACHQYPCRCDALDEVDWILERHGGRDYQAWHVVWKGPDEAKARAQYEKRYLKLRQGGLQLRDPEGIIRQRTTAPRLRTRW